MPLYFTYQCFLDRVLIDNRQYFSLAEEPKIRKGVKLAQRLLQICIKKDENITFQDLPFQEDRHPYKWSIGSIEDAMIGIIQLSAINKLSIIKTKEQLEPSINQLQEYNYYHQLTQMHNSNKVSSLASACECLLSMLRKTGEGGGLPISGLLMSEDAVVHADSNGVLREVRPGEWQVIDATSHAEQQIIYWYWANKQELALPDPTQLTIITTLDPCIMCTASALLSGFNVATISFDHYGGANFNRNAFQDFNFAPQIKKTLLQRFGYYAVEGNAERQHFKYEASHIIFKDEKIAKEIQSEISDHFFKNIGGLIQRYFMDNRLPTSELANLRDVGEEDELRFWLKKLDASALTIHLKDRVTVDGKITQSFEPTPELRHHLTQLVKSTPQAKNALALIDPHGNLLLARPDRFDVSPVHTAIVNVVIDYSQFYFEQNSLAVKEGRQFKESKAYKHLPSFYDCTFIFLNALPGDDAVSLQAIGVYAFALSRATAPAGGLIYINDYPKEAVTLEEALLHLPPQYGSKHMNIRPLLANITKEKAMNECMNE